MQNHILVWFDVQSELGGGAKLFIFEWNLLGLKLKKERGGLIFKKELGGGVRHFKGEDYFKVIKRFLDVQNKTQHIILLKLRIKNILACNSKLLTRLLLP